MAEPITDKKTFDQVITLLKKYNNNDAYADAFKLGCILGLRASDLLTLKYSDIYNDAVKIIEQKTKKVNQIDLSDKAKLIIKRRKTKYPNTTYLFETNSRRSKGRPLSLRIFNQRLQEVAQVLGLEGKLSSHTMRKTLGYQVYKQTNDLGLVCSMLNHASIKDTLKYIGITKEAQTKARNNLLFV